MSSDEYRAPITESGEDPAAPSQAGPASGRRPSVEILLAAYNGRAYLADQLQSLLSQTLPGIRILIRDDGSDDGTQALLRDYASRYPSQIRLITDDAVCGSPTSNFLQLLQYASADYVLFCDQDDFWYEYKAERMVQAALEAEEPGAPKPLLVFSDYRVVDEELQPLSIKEKNLQVSAFHLEFNRLLVQNYVTGCTMLLNRPARQALAGLPEETRKDPRILMHDWWAALYASACGKIVHLPIRLMDYRQHGGNSVGAVDVRSMTYRIGKLRSGQSKHSMQTYLEQAALFRSCYGNNLPEESLKILDDFLDIPSHSKPGRIFRLWKGRYLKSDPVRILGQFFYI